MDVPRILALLAASLSRNDSLNGSKSVSPSSPPPPPPPMALLSELRTIIEHVHAATSLNPSTANFPTLGFTADALLRFVARGMRGAPPSERLLAGETLLLLLQRCPNDDFIRAIVPGMLSGLLRLLRGWEEEASLGIVKVILECIELFLIRGAPRIRVEGKINAIVLSLARLAPPMRGRDDLGQRLVRLLLRIQTMDELVGQDPTRTSKTVPSSTSDSSSASSITAIDTLCQGIAHLAVTAIGEDSVVRAFSNVPIWDTPGLPRVAYLDRLVLVIHKLTDQVNFGRPMEVTRARAVEEHLEEMHGLLLLIPCNCWPLADINHTLIMGQVRDYLDLFIRSFIVSRDHGTGGGTMLVIDPSTFGWSSSLGIALGRVVQTVGKAENSHDYVKIIETTHDLLLISRLARGASFTHHWRDLLIDAYDRFMTRETDPLAAASLAMATASEEVWHLAWISAMEACLLMTSLKERKEGQEVEEEEDQCYVLRALLGLASHPLPSIADMAGALVDKVARARGHHSPSEMIRIHCSGLLEQIASDIRYPLLFPGAPLQLCKLIEMTSGGEEATDPGARKEGIIAVSRLLALVRDMEEGMANLQACPGYVLATLQALHAIVSLASRTSTMAPLRRDRCLEEGEEGSSTMATDSLDPIMSVEQELVASILRTVAVHFVEHAEERIRLNALSLLAAAVPVFRHTWGPLGDNGKRQLVHLTWQPVLGRLLRDPVASIRRAALNVLLRQAHLVGDFMRDRIRKELLPNVGTILAGEFTARERNQCMKSIIDMLLYCFAAGHARVSSSGSAVIPMAFKHILSLCQEGSLGPADGASLLASLASLDGDRLWYMLVVQYGSELELGRPSVPTIDLRPWRAGRCVPAGKEGDASILQSVISLARHQLGWAEGL